MSPRLQDIMRRHGLHQHIDAECQHRMEFLARLIVLECCHILKDMESDLPGYHLLQPPTHQQIYRLMKTFDLEET